MRYPNLAHLTLQARTVLLALSLVITACSDSNNNNSSNAVNLGEFALAVQSSPPEYVSGNDARVSIEVPGELPLDQVQVSLDGRDVSDAFVPVGESNVLQGRVSGLVEGDNLLAVSSSADNVTPAELVLVNHPVTGPMFSGPWQTPFQCSTDGDLAGLELGMIIDENCSVDTLVSFKYRTTSDTWGDYVPGQERPDDMATTTTIDDQEVDFIVRWERGTINRFLYSLAVLSPDSQNQDEPDLVAWNKRLIYYFQGGVAIGHYQGDPSQRRALYVDGLAAGYAVAYSTGTRTSTHYNLQLGGETAIMVKDRFVSAYEVPDYTVGVGGSGGGVQQYIYAQNHPGLIDAAIPQYSFPDMVTQMIHIGDCELIERWIDMQLMVNPNSKWADWNNRSWLIGLNASNDIPNDVISFGLTPWVPQGSSECTASWRGLSPLAMNPHFGEVPGITPEEQAEVEWTHFADLINIYGRDEDGFARRSWDNVGVQYGLQALTDGNITPEEFLDLNYHVGSWKNEPEMIQEGCPFIRDLCFALDFDKPLYPDQIDPWSWRNMQQSDGDGPAPRARADEGAIQVAIDAGMMNTGAIEIPLIDIRHYLEEQLNMHNVHQSFASRQRLLNHDGDASNQLIWFGAPGEEENYDSTMRAFAVIDQWMANIRSNPEVSVGGNRPARAVDTCFDAEGGVIASGDTVWDGILDDNAPGVCTEQFPLFSTSRIVAGAPITGDVFKCGLQSVDEAVDKGLYGDWLPSADEIHTLEEIFPEGVCDY